tara:strand:- start:185 stop:307 length:123 start_codon:yes stop_codon:yes gene_type:complete
MTLKSISLMILIGLAGFLALLFNENLVNENWMVHCLSCIG